MDDELEHVNDFTVEESLVVEYSPKTGIQKGRSKPAQGTPDRKKAERRNAKKGDQKKTGKDAVGNKRQVADVDPTKGYTHVRGGEGNLYVKMNPETPGASDKAQLKASQNGADAKLVKGKMIPLTATEKQSTMQDAGAGQPQQTQQEPQSNPDAIVVDVVDVGGQKYNIAKAKTDGERPAVKKTRPSDNKRSNLLNSPTTTGQDKSVDQKKAETAPDSDYFTGGPTISDAEFEANNDGLWLNDEERLEIPYELKNGRMPQKEVKLLERLINTQLTRKTAAIQHFAGPDAGAGQISSQAGELCMQYFASLDLEDLDETKNAIMVFLDENGNRACLNKKWVQAGANNVMAMHDHLRLKFGEDGYEVHASAWDTKDGVEALTGRDIHTPNEEGEADKGYSTDVFFTIKSSDGELSMLEASLKQDLTAKLFNGGPQSVFKLMDDEGKSMVGTKLDPSVSVGPPERKNVVNSVKNGAFADALKDAKAILKSGKMDGITSDRQKDLKSGMGAIQKLLGKNPTPEKLLKLLNKEGHEKNKFGSDAQKAAWKIIYGVHEVSKSAKVATSVKKAKKIYSDYSENWVKEYSENDDFRTGCDRMIKQRLPLVDVINGGEIVIAGRVSIDKATMEVMFGTSDPEKFRAGTKVFGPPEYEESFIGYIAKGAGEPIPIAKFRARAESLGYGNRIKVDMDIHSKFRNMATEAHGKVYGTK